MTTVERTTHSSCTDDTTAGGIDRVSTALADATRRALLDRLHAADGQRVGQLAEDFPISRQAIAEHLAVLEDAGLVVAHRESRETRYFLDPAPIREAQSRWIQKYTRVRAPVDCA